jgi:hypothetical protein
MLVADQNFGEVAPPALDRINLIALSLTGGREHQRLDLASIAAEAGCGHDDEPPAGDLGGGPSKA